MTYTRDEMLGKVMVLDCAGQDRAAAMIRQLLAESEWQPIETAPRDRDILVCSKSKGVFRVKWTVWGWEVTIYNTCCTDYLEDVVAWRELPALSEHLFR